MNIYIPESVYSKVQPDSIHIIQYEDQDNYYVISGEFQKLWKLIDGKKSREKLLSEFADLLEVEAEEVKEEVFNFLDELIAMNLVQER